MLESTRKGLKKITHNAISHQQLYFKTCIPFLYGCMCFTYTYICMLCSYYKYICDVCILYMCTHVIFTRYKYIIHVMPILHIHTCALYLYHAHMHRHTTYTHMHILYTYQALHTCTHCAHVGAHTNVGHTFFHAYTYSITLL